MEWFFVHYGFWHFIGTLILIGSIGQGCKSLFKHRQAMKRLSNKTKTKALKAENNALWDMLVEGKSAPERAHIEERLQTLESIVTSDEEDLHRRLRALPPSE